MEDPPTAVTQEAASSRGDAAGTQSQDGTAVEASATAADGLAADERPAVVAGGAAAGAEPADGEEKSPWDDPRLPWTGKPGKADIACWLAIVLSGIYLLALLPFRAALVGTHPVWGELANGATESIVAAAAFARIGHGSLAVAIIAGIPGLMKLDVVWWWAGHLWGEKVLVLVSGGQKHGPRVMNRVHKWGRRFSWPAVILSPFLPIPSALIYAVVGLAGMPLVTFLILDVIGSALWVGLLVGLGYALGHRAVVVAEAISHYGLWISIGIIVLVIGSQVLSAQRKRKARAPEPELPACVQELGARYERTCIRPCSCMRRGARCVMRESPGSRDSSPGVVMSLNQALDLPTRKRVAPAYREPLDMSPRVHRMPKRPRVVRMPADWWDSPAAVGCPLTRGPQAARAARRLTRTTLRDWGLGRLSDDAEAIVGEFVANAVTHASDLAAEGRRIGPDNLGLRLVRRTGEVICAVLDPCDSAPVLRAPRGIEDCGVEECGRGLQMVDALSDVWGWSPVAGRGKAVWAILFSA